MKVTLMVKYENWMCWSSKCFSCHYDEKPQRKFFQVYHLFSNLKLLLRIEFFLISLAF